jgi:hypothetical protein
MKKVLTALPVLSVLLFSCQKELSFDSSTNPGTGGSGGSGALLVKVVAVTGSETQTTLYTYDSERRLSTVTIDGVSGGMPTHSYQKFERDNAGRIVRVIQKLGDIGGVPSDTAVKTIHYPNASTMDCDYSVHIMGMSMGPGVPPMQTIDSTVYNYTGGKLMSYDSYMSSSLMPGMVMLKSKYEFLYDAKSRVTDMKMYSDVSNPGGPQDLMIQWNYTYGNSINGVYVSSNAAQNLLLNGLPNTGSSNLDKMVMTSANPQMNVTITTTYVLGSNGKPASGTAVSTTTGQQSGTQTTNYTFFYQ